MIVSSPFACDICGIKQESTKGWLLLAPVPEFVLRTWSDIAFAPGEVHLCGRTCAAKALQRFLDHAEIYPEAARSESLEEGAGAPCSICGAEEEALQESLGPFGPWWLSHYLPDGRRVVPMPAGVRTIGAVEMLSLLDNHPAPRRKRNPAGPRTP